jgi:hypothetical protein
MVEDSREDIVARKNEIGIVLIVLALLSFGVPACLAGVEGTWKICGFDADSMALKAVGNHVYGTYEAHQGRGSIDGVIDAHNIWIGTWDEPFNDDWGYFKVAFSNDSSRLCGAWKYAYGDCEAYYYQNFVGGWDGYFNGEKSQNNTSV